LLDAALSKPEKHGRQTRVAEQKEAALRFSSQWVRSLMETLQIDKYAELERFIDGNSERNWGRWLNSGAVPNLNDLSELLKTKIKHGDYRGMHLSDIPTNPDPDDLLTLLGYLKRTAPKKPKTTKKAEITVTKESGPSFSR
jgi:hypothetical protein